MDSSLEECLINNSNHMKTFVQTTNSWAKITISDLHQSKEDKLIRIPNNRNNIKPSKACENQIRQFLI